LLWGKNPLSGPSVRQIGKGRVYSGMSANEVLAALKTPPDFKYEKPEPDAEVMFVHRKLADGDLYFVDNRKDRPETVAATFRVDGKEPELWDAATAQVSSVSYRIAAGRTTIPLHLDPYGTAFVVFRKPARVESMEVPDPAVTDLRSIDDELNKDWTVSFEPERGAPATAAFDRLTAWNDSADPGIRYFSGTADYSKTIEIPKDAFKSGAHIWLDLGDVKEIAKITVNGRELGTVWKTPFRIDITDAITTGQNQLVVKVTNLWVNRLIGDQQSGALKQYTFTDFMPYKANSPLLPSGLLGPLRLESVVVH
jgi:hypothetical protein